MLYKKGSQFYLGLHYLDNQLKGTQSALDIIMTISSKTVSSRIALNKKQFRRFFIAKYKTCRRILRKFANFHIEFAIIGDFSSFTSKPLKDFIYECNQEAIVTCLKHYKHYQKNF
jgi:hypothetical protein